MSGPADLLLVFFALCGIGVLLPFLVHVRWSPIVLSVAGTLGAFAILLMGGKILMGGMTFRIALWPVLSLGTLTLGADGLSALFLFVTALVFLPVSIFSAVYLRKYKEHHSLRYFCLLYFALFASVVLTLIAEDTISFLVGWEAMSITSYLLVNYECDRADGPYAAFVMLAMSEAGTIAVALAFILVASVTGTFDFTALRSGHVVLGYGIGWAVFLLSFFGFAVKAGLVPVNSWLPLAHPVAPTNVSALLSAVIVNLGIYGIVRVNLDLVPITTTGPGLVVLMVGAVSALVGILYATTQAEMKRLLAHSTIENMGIVAVAIGAAIVFLATGDDIIAGIALIAAFYHLLNHAVYKALLFLGTGAVEAGAGTRDLDQLGGMIRQMPWTAAFFLVGVLSISALPPLNGFVSEWLTLQTILRSALLPSTAIKIAFAMSGALVALTAGLAVTCFAKVFAMGFLGMARSEGAVHAREAHIGMRIPLGLLAGACFMLGVLPTYVIPVLDRVTTPLTHASATAALIPPFFTPDVAQQEGVPAPFVGAFHDLGAQVGRGVLPGRGLIILHRGEENNPVVFAMSTSYMFGTFVLILALTFGAFWLVTRSRTVLRGAVWAGGLRRLTPGITYTATGFSNPVRVIFQFILSPATVEDSTEAVAQHFRTAIRREDTEIHIVDRLVLRPPIQGVLWLATLARKMHGGHVNTYAAYVLVAMLVMLVFSAVRMPWLRP